ncbi:MAG: site-specific tyrosine recombinase/integron integrase [Candidatus Hodarchaeota archaeon]
MNPKVYEKIVEYLTAKEVEKGLSPQTIKAYEHDLNLFFRFIGSKPLKKIKTQDVRSFLNHLKKEKNYSKPALARKISSLRTFFSFLVSERHLEKDPMEKISTPKLDKTLPLVLTPKEAEKFMKEAQKRNARDYAIIVTFLHTGIRVQELCDIKLTDIDYENKTLRIKGKGGKTRIVRISSRALSSIKKHLETRKNTGSEFLFLSNRNRKLSKREVQRIVKKYILFAGLNPKISCHKLRHTFATHSLQKGMDIRLIQRQLGHQKLSTTEKYTKISDEFLSKEYDKAWEKQT